MDILGCVVVLFSGVGLLVLHRCIIYLGGSYHKKNRKQTVLLCGKPLRSMIRKGDSTMKHKFNKILTLALAAALTVGAVCATPVTARAAEGDDDFREIIDSVWGPSGKDKYGEVEDSGYRNGGQTVTAEEMEQIRQKEMLEKADSTSTPDPEPSTPAQDSGSSDNGSGSSNESYTPADSGSNDSGSSDTGSAPANTTATPSQSTPAQPNAPAGAPASTPVVNVTDAAGNTTAVKVTATAPVTDEAFLAAFPGATFVLAPNGFTTIAVTDAQTKAFQVYYMGQLADAFYIADAKNNFVTISAFQFVTEATGKTYVDVTIDKKVKKPVVAASAEQKAAFARLFGIDGVKVNGELLEEFVGDPALAN